MAINKTKAGSLAALAGLAYLASQKGKKGEDSGPTAADREDAEMGTMMRANAAPAAAAPEVENTMGEDERPAATGMGAATKMLEPIATPRPRPTTAGKTGSGSGGGRGPKFGEREAYEESRAKTSRPITEADKNKNAADMYTLGALAKNRDYKKGGAIKKMASGGMTSSASSRGDGIASKGKTRGRMC